MSPIDQSSSLFGDMMQTQTLVFEHDGDELEQYASVDTSMVGPRPLVLVAHAWRGQDDFARAKADGLAALGYVGVAIDMYGRGVHAADAQEAASLMQPFASDRAYTRERLRANLEAALRLDDVDPDRVGAIGFCFGGMCVLELARSGADLRAVTSFHGMLDTDMPAESGAVQASILVCHGHDDPWATPDVVRDVQQEMTEAGADWQMHIYGGTMHAFTHVGADDPESGVRYDANADRRSWRAMRGLFEDVF
jgi:dienelactone hydrolase